MSVLSKWHLAMCKVNTPSSTVESIKISLISCNVEWFWCRMEAHVESDRGSAIGHIPHLPGPVVCLRLPHHGCRSWRTDLHLPRRHRQGAWSHLLHSAPVNGLPRLLGLVALVQPDHRTGSVSLLVTSCDCSLHSMHTLSGCFGKGFCFRMRPPLP